MILFADIEGPDQTARMRRLIWALTVRMAEDTFSHGVAQMIFYVLPYLTQNFSRRHLEIFFLFFLENRIWHFMQIVS